MGKKITNEKLLDTEKIYFGMYNNVITKKQLTEKGVIIIPYSVIRFGILYEVLDGVYIDIITEETVAKNKIDITRFNKFDELIEEELPEKFTVECITKITNYLLNGDYVEEINRNSKINFNLKSLDSDNMYTKFLNDLEIVLGKVLSRIR